jgi:DNA-directed RNA polymerase specialized sigma24 family protein
MAGERARVFRMALALTGRDDVARGIVRFTTIKVLKRLRRFREADDLKRWISHHCVLLTRRAAHHPAAEFSEPLASPGSGVMEVAFFKALRQLPAQQREAFILHHGEQWTGRQLAVAMDCSTTAAEMHLREASARLGQLAGATLPRLVETLVHRYASLAPAEQFSLVNTRAALRSLRRRERWIRRILSAMLLLAIVVAAVILTRYAPGWFQRVGGVMTPG